MKGLRKVAVVLGVGAAFALASPATATPICAGTQQQAGLCVEVGPGDPTYEDCVYLGPPPCTPVSVPGVDVDCVIWASFGTFPQCA